MILKDFDNLILLVPEKGDVERDAVAAAWLTGGGKVLRLDRFWEPPELDTAHVRLYGNHTFCLVLAEKLGLDLISPADDWLAHVPNDWLKRSIRLYKLSDVPETIFPAFIKPVVPKTFRAAIYEQRHDLLSECRGLSPDAEIIASEIVAFASEARTFIMDGQIVASAVYEGTAELAEAEQFVQSLVQSVALPRACVIDVGYIEAQGWVLLETNSAWSAGLNGCDPYGAARCVAYATERRSQ